MAMDQEQVAETLESFRQVGERMADSLAEVCKAWTELANKLNPLVDLMIQPGSFDAPLSGPDPLPVSDPEQELVQRLHVQDEQSRAEALRAQARTQPVEDRGEPVPPPPSEFQPPAPPYQVLRGNDGWIANARYQLPNADGILVYSRQEDGRFTLFIDHPTAGRILLDPRTIGVE